MKVKWKGDYSTDKSSGTHVYKVIPVSVGHWGGKVTLLTINIHLAVIWQFWENSDVEQVFRFFGLLTDMAL